MAHARHRPGKVGATGYCLGGRVSLLAAGPFPDRVAATLARYGVSPEGREALDAYWTARFDADPLLRMMFARGFAAYVAWLKANPGTT